MCRATCLQTLEGLIPRVAPGVLHRTLFVEAQLSRHWWAAVRAEAILSGKGALMSLHSTSNSATATAKLRKCARRFILHEVGECCGTRWPRIGPD